MRDDYCYLCKTWTRMHPHKKDCAEVKELNERLMRKLKGGE